LKDDEILCKQEAEGLIVTRWRVLKPRKDFVRGYSCYFLHEGLKVSWFIDAADKLLYHYCDIIHTEYDAAADAYTFHDLLADVIVMPDGAVKVLDVGEIAKALDAGLITLDMAKQALTLLDKLLTRIYAGQFRELTERAMPYIEEGMPL